MRAPSQSTTLRLLVALLLAALLASRLLLPRSESPTGSAGAAVLHRADSWAVPGYFQHLLDGVGGEAVGDAGTLDCARAQREGGWPQPRSGPSSEDPTPMYVLALGAEGTGHHALQSLLRGLPHRHFRYEPNLHLAAPRKQYTTLSAQVLLRRIMEGLANSSAPSAPGERPLILDSQHSCPFGQPRAVMRCPDVVHLLRLHKQGALELRVVLLARDPVDAALSALRRGFARGGDAGEELRTLEFSLSQLEHLYRLLPCELKFFLPFRLLVAKPPDLPARLAAFLGLGQHGEAAVRANMAAERWRPRPDSAAPATGSAHGPNKPESPLDRLDMCRAGGVAGTACEAMLRQVAASHFGPRRRMWPILSTLTGAGAWGTPAAPSQAPPRNSH